MAVVQLAAVLVAIAFFVGLCRPWQTGHTVDGKAADS
jgi:DHA1 family bicyclomycin/chloramphenicol resistance-like MFS transporter